MTTAGEGKMLEFKENQTNADSEREPTFIKKQMNDISSVNFWRAFFAEYLGTFMLCLFTIGYGLHDPKVDSPPGLFEAAVSSGLMVSVCILSTLTVSGGNVNPAISVGFLVDGQITLVRFFAYVIAQCSASVSAVLFLKAAVPPEMHGSMNILLPGPDVKPYQALLMEFAIDFVLLFVTMAITDSRRTDFTEPAPMFVGFTVVANIFFAGRISGGCMNPARNFGPALVTGNMKLHWIYWVGPMLGGVAGSLTYSQIFSVRAIDGESFSLCRRRRRSSKSVEKKGSVSSEREHMI